MPECCFTYPSIPVPKVPSTFEGLAVQKFPPIDNPPYSPNLAPSVYYQSRDLEQQRQGCNEALDQMDQEVRARFAA